MKPIIIYQDRKDDKISLSKRDFEKYIQDAYDEGYNCGFNNASRLYYTPFTTTPNYPYWYTTGTIGDQSPKHTEVTCTGTDKQWLTHPTVTAAEVPPCTLTTADTTEKIEIKYKQNNK